MTLKKQVVKKNGLTKLVLIIQNLKKKSGKWVKKNLKTIVEEAEDFIREKRELVEKAKNELQGAK